jgi:small subunit ribosomal protein S4
MATFHAHKCRLCRREGEKLFLKGTRCFTEKCAFERRGYAPGEHGKDRRSKETSYGLQLRMKQKTRRIYGILERQFRNYFAKAESQKGVTGENLLRMLELRLDNVAFRAGWGSSRSQARQLVRHGHVNVNGRRVTIPSYVVRKGDVVELRDKAKAMIVIRHNIETIDRTVPPWLEPAGDKASVTVRDLPMREHIDVPVREQLIVELYSK